MSFKALKEGLSLLLEEGNNIKDEPRPPRMARPPINDISLTKEQRPLDYGQCHSILIDKYGEKEEILLMNISLYKATIMLDGK